MGRQKNRRTTASRSRKTENTSPGQTAAASGDRTLPGQPRRKASRSSAENLVSFPSPSQWPGVYWAVVAGLSLAFLYSYWPTIRWMTDSWMNQADYSHGWVVPVLALLICYFRSGSFPGVSPSPSWGGLSLVAVAILMRFVSTATYTDFMDGWSMLAMIGGMVWCLMGLRAFLWALPAIGFLFFAVPMPYQLESMLSWRLQGVATGLSTIFLRVIGLPAVSEGHTVWIGSQPLNIAEACSGLRIFVGMAAFAYYWAAINQRGWSDKIVILAAAIPAAILVNALRIVLIGVLYAWYDDESARRWIHDVSGILMIFASFGAMYLVNVYWQKLYGPVRKLTARELLPDSASRRPKHGSVVVDSPSQSR